MSACSPFPTEGSKPHKARKDCKVGLFKVQNFMCYCSTVLSLVSFPSRSRQKCGGADSLSVGKFPVDSQCRVSWSIFYASIFKVKAIGHISQDYRIDPCLQASIENFESKLMQNLLSDFSVFSSVEVSDGLRNTIFHFPNSYCVALADVCIRFSTLGCAQCLLF